MPVYGITTELQNKQITKQTKAMIEVFKTDVKGRIHAKMLVNQIHQAFPEYTANFDLEDCDKILRVVSATGFIQYSLLINLLKDSGCNVQVLPDEENLLTSQIVSANELAAK